MMKPKRDEVELVDGTLYFTADNWETVWCRREGVSQKVTDKEEADRARFLAIAQAHGGN